MRVIAEKDPAQLYQLAADTLNYWDPEGYQQIGSRLAAAQQTGATLHLVCSADYQEMLPGVLGSARLHGAGEFPARTIDGGHFDLIEPEVLFPVLDELESAPRPAATGRPGTHTKKVRK